MLGNPSRPPIVRSFFWRVATVSNHHNSRDVIVAARQTATLDSLLLQLLTNRFIDLQACHAKQDLQNQGNRRGCLLI
jgi:hypothetical protein